MTASDRVTQARATARKTGTCPVCGRRVVRRRTFTRPPWPGTGAARVPLSQEVEAWEPDYRHEACRLREEARLVTVMLGGPRPGLTYGGRTYLVAHGRLRDYDQGDWDHQVVGAAPASTLDALEKWLRRRRAYRAGDPSVGVVSLEDAAADLMGAIDDAHQEHQEARP